MMADICSQALRRQRAGVLQVTGQPRLHESLSQKGELYFFKSPLGQLTLVHLTFIKNIRTDD